MKFYMKYIATINNIGYSFITKNIQFDISMSGYNKSIVNFIKAKLWRVKYLSGFSIKQYSAFCHEIRSDRWFCGQQNKYSISVTHDKLFNRNDNLLFFQLYQVTFNKNIYFIHT